MPEPAWTSYLTLDLLAHILSRSLLHPFIACLIPLCLRACAKPYTSPSMILSIAWAGLVLLSTLVSAIDQRIAHGPPREVGWEDEVVVITGGASGLGKVLAEMFGMRGASVAVLDLRVPGVEALAGNEALAGVKWYACDVSSLEDVRRAKAAIEKDLGPATILINNAAGPIAGTPLLSLPQETYTRTLHVNLLSHFHVLTTFLPSLLSRDLGGTVVTIASVLGKLGAANLSDYTASKAGLIAMHNSLTQELRAPDAQKGSDNVRTILVTPGQLSTGLFAGVELPWYAHFLGPVVEPVELAREIVRMVDAGMGGEVSLPLYARWIEWMFVLPRGLQRVMRAVTGIDEAMRGREGKKER